MEHKSGLPFGAISVVPPFESSHEGRMEKLARHQVAAALAGGMIAATGRPHTAEEAVAVFRDVVVALYPPAPSEGAPTT